MFEIPQETTIRQHIRLILQNVGYPLTDFEFRLELIEAIRDIVSSTRATLSIVQDEHSCSDTRTSATSVHRRRRGLLIDFDHCAYVVRSEASQDTFPGPEVPPTMTGTVAFMAVGVLHVHVLGTESTSRFVHYPSYDLESILYIIIWLCIKYSGPGESRKIYPKGEDKQPPTTEWYNMTSDLPGFARFRDQKVAHLTNLNRLIFPWFKPYFSESMKQCMAHYVAALFGWPRLDVNLISAFESSGPLDSMVANSAARWDDVSRVLEETATKLRKEGEEPSTVEEIDRSTFNAQQAVSPGLVELVKSQFICHGQNVTHA
ncbi:hypothetical protein WOLCODRAFT_153413 [Wolfiporia cocos MD-104 SS10]|uniref:Fungal-type protein kinase domain-containing protein n=1 Tax=Wolfiporia cocos (strain MD-104) TaxID=742152 RepID=A0A2H3JMD2_WOLCO|nr:hypothetical protein WOLCODRAFT_153413 [Wolfiporia cocos MD-104 SS10]